MLKNNRGESKIGVILAIIVVAAAGYAGLQWGYARWDAANFREDVNRTLGYWVNRGNPVQKHMIIEILQKAEMHDIKLYEEDIVLDINERAIQLYIYWETPLTFPGGYTYYLPFEIERDVRFRR